ncbi:LPXTG cell wall anchor domain-containing protein [Enterococcus sp. C73]|uniref:LPXTG cell wall anchor domain-containing protein n=1 Tax=Enterococcus sp. C73 TaxID=3231331 RepID=UPI0034A05652
MKKLAILFFVLSGFLVKENVYAANTQQKSNAESQVTITFVEGPSKNEQTIRKGSKNIDLDRRSKTLLPSTGSKMDWLVFLLGVLVFLISATILSIRRENRRNNI